jgi:hypothetical protein
MKLLPTQIMALLEMKQSHPTVASQASQKTLTRSDPPLCLEICDFCEADHRDEIEEGLDLVRLFGHLRKNARNRTVSLLKKWLVSSTAI